MLLFLIYEYTDLPRVLVEESYTFIFSRRLTALTMNPAFFHLPLAGAFGDRYVDDYFFVLRFSFV